MLIISSYSLINSILVSFILIKQTIFNSFTNQFSSCVCSIKRSINKVNFNFCSSIGLSIRKLIIGSGRRSIINNIWHQWQLWMLFVPIKNFIKVKLEFLKSIIFRSETILVINSNILLINRMVSYDIINSKSSIVNSHFIKVNIASLTIKYDFIRSNFKSSITSN